MSTSSISFFAGPHAAADDEFAAGAVRSKRPSVPSIQTTFAPESVAVPARRSIRSQDNSAVTAGFVTRMTPPETPSSPPADMELTFLPSPLFQKFLRAMHHFDPSAATMPGGDASHSAAALKPGDLILVHCIHANGWADGTVLNTGVRGWLPTNFCEAYDHPYLRNLLHAITQFWDLLCASEDASLSTFVRQDYIRGLIAGVRYLLERADCLHREAPSVKQYPGIRRMRKGLLADLSSLVQIAKRMQDTIGEAFAGEVIHVLLDDLISKAFKVVTRAVSFTDVWTQESSPVIAGYDRLPVPRAPVNPSTAEKVSLAIDTKTAVSPRRIHAVDSAKEFVDTAKLADESAPVSALSHADEPFPTTSEPPPTGGITSNLSRRSVVFTPPEGTVAHRLSLVPKENNGTASGLLASEQLARVHDVCISHIGAYIGHHLHSRPCSELVSTTTRLVDACKDLLAIVDEVFTHDAHDSVPVHQSRGELEHKVDELARSTKAVFRFSDSLDDEAIMLPDQSNHLINVGTSLIRSTGECVMRTRLLIEQTGDFELKTSSLGSASRSPEKKASEHVETPTPTLSPGTETPITPQRLSKRFSRSMQPPPSVPPEELPIPVASPVEAAGHTPISDSSPEEGEEEEEEEEEEACDISFPLPPTLERQSLVRDPTASDHVDEACTGPQEPAAETILPARKDSVGVSINSSVDTYHSSIRDSDATAASQASTRATTPDHGKELAGREPAMTDSFHSCSSLQYSSLEDSCLDAEAQLLRKTYANEMSFNKEGQVTGGSLPALVEQLTTHDSAPDPQFVTAFFLTFRKFCEPREFAQALIDRFDYIGDSRTVGIPARLRIYNVFKNWLETHWNADADKAALGDIRFFALHKLKPVLSSAGERLAELTRRITEGYASGTLTGPLVACRGKTTMSIGTQSRKDPDAPEPVISTKQLNALRLATGGGAPCSIVDLDPVEVARQITLRVIQTYCEIGPDELLSMDWNKPNTRKAKHIRDMCALNTDLAHMVGDTILAPEEPKKRAGIIKQWIKIGTACLELSNYDTVMAIVCTLSSSVIDRLKRTWDLVNKKALARLEELKNVVDVSKNYSALRKRLDAPAAACIPFLGVYLTDLTFVVAGNPKRRDLPGSASASGAAVSVINFDMYMRIAKIISHLQRFQVGYKLRTVPELQTWLSQHLRRMRDAHDDLLSVFHLRSLLLEPKEIVRKHSLVASAFRADSEERPRTAAGSAVSRSDLLPSPSVPLPHPVPSPATEAGRFDLFMKSGSFHMRSSAGTGAGAGSGNTSLASDTKEQSAKSAAAAAH